MDYFNFSYLPLLVKEMIADEIVHNSIPEDRIQFATTCKAFNQLVKHAKPKKIIRRLRLYDCLYDGLAIQINSGKEQIMTLPELENILQQCQVENLSISAFAVFLDMHSFSELMDLLLEPCRFVIALSFWFFNTEFKYVDFYKKLRHLKSLTSNDSSIMDLPYIPPKLVLRSKYSLPLLAEKTLNHPLSFLEYTKEVPLTEIQQFLKTANLEIGAQIRFYFKNKFAYFLTFIGNGLFEFQILRKFDYFILDQQISSQNKKILKLSTDFGSDWFSEIPFTVTSVSNPDIVVCSGELTNESREKVVSENVAEFVKISFPGRCYSTYYSRQLLDHWFPRIKNYDPFDRVETINKTLGTNISVIKPEPLEEKNGAQRSLIYCNVTPDEWKVDRPKFLFGKDHVAVKYFRNGIIWKLKDANGNDKIPFKISFNEEVYVGAAAEEHSEYLVPDLDLEILANATIRNKTSKISFPFFKDVDNELKIMLKTAKGPQKTAPKNILAIFVKSIVKLLEEKLENPVKKIYLNFDFSHELSKNSQFLLALNILNIDYD